MRIVRALAAGAAASVLLALGWLGFVWPPPSWYASHWPAKTAFMRMRDHQARAAHDTTSRRYRPVPLDSISDWLEKAATAGEDDAFYQHHGIDWRSLRQAMGYRRDAFSWSDPRDRAALRAALASAWSHRDRLRGASTITQQLAKNLYLSPSRNPLRKVKEAVIAYRLEWALPKERILALYLNVAEFGPNLWGVEAASQRYFHTSAARLTMDQAALLVATLPHPLSSNPALRPGRTRWRQQLILRRLRGESVTLPDESDDTSAAPPMPAGDSAAAAPVPGDSAPPAADSTTPRVLLPADTAKPETKPPER